jgi:hypothetical protein
MPLHRQRLRGLLASKRFVTNFVQSLAAVLAGNAAYFLLMPVLPLWARHVPFRTDFGLAVDALFCLVALGIIKWVAGRPDPSKSAKP